MDRLSKIALVAGLASFVLGAALSIWDIAERATPMVVAWASILLFFAIFRTYLSKKGEVYKDERTQKVQFTAMAISWWVTYVTLAATYLLTVFDFLSLSLEHLPLVIIFVMAVSYLIGLTYISRRGL